MKSKEKPIRTVFEEQNDIFAVMERLLSFLIKKNEELMTRCGINKEEKPNDSNVTNQAN